MRWGNHPGLSGRAQYNHKGHYKKESSGLESQKSKVMTNTEREIEKC